MTIRQIQENNAALDKKAEPGRDSTDTLLSKCAKELAAVLRGDATRPPSAAVSLDDESSSEIYHRFVHVIADCAHLVNRDHQTVVTAILHRTSAYFGTSSVVPWHTSTEPSNSTNSMLTTITEPDDALTTAVILLGDRDAAYVPRRNHGKWCGVHRRICKRALALAATSAASLISGSCDEKSESSKELWQRATRADLTIMLSRSATFLATMGALSRLNCAVTLQSHVRCDVSQEVKSASETKTSDKGCGHKRASSSTTTPPATSSSATKRVDSGKVKKELATVKLNVRTLYFGARLAFSVSFTGNAPCEVRITQPGFHALWYADRFVQLVEDVRTCVEAFEREVLFWECARRATDFKLGFGR